MFNALIKNWKTTLFGAVSAGFGALGAAAGVLTWKQALPLFLTAAIGFVGKDHNVTGGDVHQ